MAAATGYDDAPTDEQLLAYADLPNFGKEMAEVFAVRVPAAAAGGNRPPPCGRISFHGGRCIRDCIYLRSPTDDGATSPPACDSQGNLVLTGPSYVISAEGPIIFHIDLYDGNEEPSLQEEKEYKPQIFCNTCDGFPNNKYDRAIVETVNTDYGPADVIYAILRNGVEGQVSVKLARWEGEGRTAIFGRIVARSKLLNVGCVLFYNEHDKNICAGSEQLIPLSRHALAVPLNALLVIELDLQCYSGDEIVRGALEINPATEGQHIERLIGMNGAEIEVTISWTKHPW